MCINSYRTKRKLPLQVQCGVDVQGNNLSSLCEKQECKILQILKVVLSYTNNVSQALPLNSSNILVFDRNTDLNLTGSMSSHTRQPFPLFQVQRRVTLDGPFRYSRSKVQSHSTGLTTVPGAMSSHTRQRFPLFQDQCRAQIDMLFYSVLFWFSLNSCYLVAAVELRII